MIDPKAINFDSTPVSPDRPLFAYRPASLTSAKSPAAGPVVSVVTPLFNTGRVFHETARCLLGDSQTSGQSLQNFEWIIVNDASSDPECLAILDDYRQRAKADPRIRILDHRVNHGLPATRNTGWRAACAPYIFFLDSDDLIEPTTLEKCALHLACNPEFAFVKGCTAGFGAQQYLWTRGFHDHDGFLDQNLVTATAMVRASALEKVGGFDEAVRAGMEDWEFWLRCAALGLWGATIPEVLDWYRRRDEQHSAWDNISRDDKRRQFVDRFKASHPDLSAATFPRPEAAWHMPFTEPAAALFPKGLVNPLEKSRQRLLMIVPWLRMGGADRFNLDLIAYLTRHADWDVTVASTLPGHPWLGEFLKLTPDVFMLDHLGRLPNVPGLLSHLITSRRPDVVMISNSQLGYFLLPWLRATHPECAFVDFNHMEEPHWQNGGHPRTGAGFQTQLDLSIVVSEHLKKWMCSPPRTSEPERTSVCHINADTQRYRPDAAARARWRSDLQISDDECVILYAARLCAQKQPMVFARTMEMLAQTAKPGSFTALVAGGGELQAQLESALSAKGLSLRVRVLGSISASDMPGLMASADVFFLPSQWEGIALSIYEAMSTGLAVVGADVGGQSELVTPETGILLKFPQRGEALEAQKYAGVLHQLIEEPKRMKALGNAARERIQKHFELDNMGQRMLELFAKAQQLSVDHPRAPVDVAFGRELALQGIEMMRIQELAENLWPYREKYYALSGKSIPAAEREMDSEARIALERIQSSTSYKLVQKLKRVPPWSIYSRIRHGPGAPRQP